MISLYVATFQKAKVFSESLGLLQVSVQGFSKIVSVHAKRWSQQRKKTRHVLDTREGTVIKAEVASRQCGGGKCRTSEILLLHE